MNSVCERFLGSVRRECVDQTIVLGERHLEHVLKDYCFNHFNVARPRQGIRQQVPVERTLKLKRRTNPARVVGEPVLGGLHNRYRDVA